MFSIFTPLHAAGNKFISWAYQSLTEQTITKWEWVILENNGGKVPQKIRRDKRVRVIDSISKNIGALKRQACYMAKGQWLVELDADDMLAPEALSQLKYTFERGAEFVFSDFAEFHDQTMRSNVFNSEYGWKSYSIQPYGFRVELRAMRAPDATAHNIRYIDWAPNHVRAWDSQAYDRIGGHDASMAVADDHDLVVRTYLAGCKIQRIPNCLYFYRIHGGNTVTSRNAEIRDGTSVVYNKYLWKLAEKWTAEKRLLKVDLCGGVDPHADYFVLDRAVPKGRKGKACDLEKRWPLKDSSVGLLRAHDAVEHLKDPIHTMNEAWRVLAPGGWLMLHIPSSNGMGAFCDPTHKSFWNRLSLRYYTDKNFARYIPEFKGKFQVSRVIEWFPSAWHKDNNMPYVEAHLFAVKDGFRAMGEYLW